MLNCKYFYLFFFVLLLFFNTWNALPTRSGNEAFWSMVPDLDLSLASKSWFGESQRRLKSKLSQSQVNLDKAKNIIMFLGDGMSIATVTAARILRGQRAGMFGEETSLYFDEFPHIGLSKTYCLDKQVTDSAASATAYLSGVKSNFRTIGVSGQVKLYDCEGSMNPNNYTPSIAAWAQSAGMETGFVTTTRVTHASPAGLFGHIAHRDWESDKNIIEDGMDPNVCEDLASQLVTGEVGKKFKVILGGGRREFLPNTTLDLSGSPGKRKDGRNLIEEWKDIKASSGKKAAYVTNKKELFEASKMADYIFGLFQYSHMDYHLEADPEKQPRLAELTSVAIDMLTKKDKGFFLFVEGGRIDHGHHDGYTTLALDETIEFAEAIKTAVEKTGEDTLIVVTSDHAHTMSFSGYSNRGDDILKTFHQAKNNLNFATLLYANGPGFRGQVNGTKFDMATSDDINDIRYTHTAGSPLEDETHGGDDVLIFARGPWSHLFNGVFEQNYIPHAMAYAACIGNGLKSCSHWTLKQNMT